MTRLNPAFASLKTLDITYQTPQQTLLGTPETLPTSEPSTPQIGYTVQNSDLPALNLPCHKKVFVAVLFGAGRCPTAATVYFRMKKNGASIYSASNSVTANYYYTVNAFFYDIAVGDLLELALWSTASDSNWDYKGFAVLVTRIIIQNKPRLLSPCNLVIGTYPNLTGVGSPSIASTGNLLPYHCDSQLGGLSANASFEFLYPKDTYGMFRLYNGDSSYLNSGAVLTSSSSRPRYYRNYVPTQIKFRGVRTD